MTKTNKNNKIPIETLGQIKGLLFSYYTETGQQRSLINLRRRPYYSPVVDCHVGIDDDDDLMSKVQTCQKSTQNGSQHWCLRPLVDGSERSEQHAVTAHGIQDPWQGEHGSEQTGAEGKDSSDADDPFDDW